MDQIHQIVRLNPGREKSVIHRHPWIFSGSIASVENSPGRGDTVRILDSAGNYLGLGAYSPESKIRVRTWTHREDQPVDKTFFIDRIRRAVESRRALALLDTGNTACRLVFAESDGIPGFIADLYGEQLVVQFLSAGAERWKAEIVEALIAVSGVPNVYERSDVEVRALEGLTPESGVLAGTAPGPEVEILEEGLHYGVDVVSGHKTGFYLDQRWNRRRVRDLAAGREVLNCFAYSGAFSAAALAGDAGHVLSIESSSDAVRLGEANLARNGFSADRHEWLEGDVFAELRTLRDRGRSFDMVLLDPPKFAATRRQAEGAARGYKDINLLAFKLLRPGGMLFTFSCSGGINAEFFQKVVAGAAVDAGAEAQIFERLTQGPDHPTALNFPESEYLKGLVIRKIA